VRQFVPVHSEEFRLTKRRDIGNNAIAPHATVLIRDSRLPESVLWLPQTVGSGIQSRSSNWPSTDRVNIDEIDFLSGIMIEPNFQIEEGEIVGNSGATHWDPGVTGHDHKHRHEMRASNYTRISKRGKCISKRVAKALLRRSGSRQGTNVAHEAAS
jgi:hypothetical protein